MQLMPCYNLFLKLWSIYVCTEDELNALLYYFRLNSTTLYVRLKHYWSNILFVTACVYDYTWCILNHSTFGSELISAITFECHIKCLQIWEVNVLIINDFTLKSTETNNLTRFEIAIDHNGLAGRILSLATRFPSHT